MIQRLGVPEDGGIGVHSLRRIISETSESEYTKARELLAIPLRNSGELYSGRRWVVRRILEQPGDKGWRLDAALVLTHGSEMKPADFLPFINTLAKDDRFFRTFRRLNEVDEATRQGICAVADAITAIDYSYRFDSEGRSIFNRTKFKSAGPGGTMIFHNRTVSEALFDHPDKAGLIADLFLERGSLDVLDELLEAPAVIAEGSL